MDEISKTAAFHTLSSQQQAECRRTYQPVAAEKLEALDGDPATLSKADLEVHLRSVRAVNSGRYGQHGLCSITHAECRGQQRPRHVDRSAQPCKPLDRLLELSL